MLLGDHEHTLDDKNRLTLPAKLREHLGTEVVITRGLDGCLAVYSRAAFHLLAARVGFHIFLPNRAALVRRAAFQPQRTQ